MALSDEWVKDLATDCFDENWAVKKAVGMIREAESEVRKQYDALVRQMLDAMGEYASAFGQALDAHGIDHSPQQANADKKMQQTVAAARAWLEGNG